MSRIQLICILSVLSAFSAVNSSFSAPLQSLAVYPPDVQLTTARGRQSFVVQATFADGITRDVTAEAKVTLANPALRQARQERPHAGRRRRHAS